jgi:hypothetical protein
MSVNHGTSGEPSRDRPRRPYTKPELMTYGTLHAITQNAGQQGIRADAGGKGANDKTA